MEMVRDPKAQRDGSAVVVLCAEEVVRDAVGYWFSALPVRTFVASDGYEANRLLRNPSCRLLITDRVLPPWPGLDTFLQLRADNAKLRIAFVDGGGPDVCLLARVTGASVILPKPLTRQSVVDALAIPEFVPSVR